MQVTNVEVDRYRASQLMRKYQEHRLYQKPTEVDLEIERIYRQIARGRVVVRALDSVRKAGLGADGLPKLALARADAPVCHLSIGSSNRCMMSVERFISSNTATSKRFNFDDAFQFSDSLKFTTHSAIVPLIPPDIRPARGIANYHILWDAVWSKEPPVDPLLLRRMGKGDAWLVCGAWDLTPVERAVLADRVR